ncbi:hypothetical protein VB796_16530 [Arcicella sp. LKC2W]|uniref:hypothetical protein n=1 Tax=Arcicella sp. LKC2W TaxID=2984198 RepID=UPI002B1F6E37|nr:hypothetical protein [Arcicella sp. LKC2W]MEA5460665.1 hypothetical protein [Arcicella sp. LKC2W]
MKKKITTALLGILGLLFVSFATIAQNYTIKGKIADSNGQPMIGAINNYNFNMTKEYNTSIQT